MTVLSVHAFVISFWALLSGALVSARLAQRFDTRLNWQATLALSLILLLVYGVAQLFALLLRLCLPTVWRAKGLGQERRLSLLQDTVRLLATVALCLGTWRLAQRLDAVTATSINEPWTVTLLPFILALLASGSLHSFNRWLPPQHFTTLFQEHDEQQETLVELRLRMAQAAVYWQQVCESGVLVGAALSVLLLGQWLDVVEQEKRGSLWNVFGPLLFFEYVYTIHAQIVAVVVGVAVHRHRQQSALTERPTARNIWLWVSTLGSMLVVVLLSWFEILLISRLASHQDPRLVWQQITVPFFLAMCIVLVLCLLFVAWLMACGDGTMRLCCIHLRYCCRRQHYQHANAGSNTV